MQRANLLERQAKMREKYHRHGRGRPPKFDLAAIARYAEEHPLLTQTEIAEQLGCSQSTVCWAMKMWGKPKWEERKVAKLNARLLAIEEELARDPLKERVLESIERNGITRRRRGRPPKPRCCDDASTCLCDWRRRIAADPTLLAPWLRVSTDVLLAQLKEMLQTTSRTHPLVIEK